MKNRLVPLCIFAIFTPAAVAQMVVDATGPAHSRMRNPTAGHVGSIGRKLPVELRVKVGALSSDFAENHEVEFIIVNLSKEDLTIPVSPNPGDLEPADPKVSYRLKFMRLYLTTGDAQQAALQGGAELYGNDSSPDSLVSLRPGQSLDVRARVRIPSTSAPSQSDLRFIAHLVLDDQDLQTVDGQTSEDTQEIGSATSRIYSLQDLFNGTD